MDDLENLSDDQIQQLISLGVIPEQQDALQQQIKQAESLRDAQAPQGSYSRGGIYVAASPLEHIARVMQGLKAKNDLKGLYQQQQDQFGQQVQGRQAFLDALRNRTRVGKGPHSYTVGQPKMQNFTLDPSLLGG